MGGKGRSSPKAKHPHQAGRAEPSGAQRCANPVEVGATPGARASLGAGSPPGAGAVRRALLPSGRGFPRVRGSPLGPAPLGAGAAPGSVLPAVSGAPLEAEAPPGSVLLPGSGLPAGIWAPPGPGSPALPLDVRGSPGSGRPALRRPRPAFGVLRSRPENQGAEVSPGRAVPGKHRPLGGKAGELLVKRDLWGSGSSRGWMFPPAAGALPPLAAAFRTGELR